MPTLGPSTDPDHWESFLFDRSFCFPCSEVQWTEVQYITFSEVVGPRIRNTY